MNYRLIHYGFYGDDHTPSFTVQQEHATDFSVIPLTALGGTLCFTTEQRYCTGWHDLANGNSSACSTNSKIGDQYEQCRECMEKTGFNPAFYHAATISPQQQLRNNQPHILYLAHFAPGIMKVGISWKQRGIRRLLEQGARSVIILGTYPTAEAARQKEAAIAREADIAETVQLRHKLQHLQQRYDAQTAKQELLSRARSLAEKYDLPKEQQVQHLDAYYFAIPPESPIDLSKERQISGSPLGMLGGILLFAQDDQAYSLPIHKLKGYHFTHEKAVTKNEHAPIQATLF